MLKKLKMYLRPENNIDRYKDQAFDQSFNWQWDKINYNRIALINLLLGGKTDQSYLEIGCQENNLFNSIPVEHKIGVDPEIGGNRKMTSDDFFRINKDKFDVIFIDGLHTYQQVRKDIINSMKCLNPGGWIAMHDMLPGNWIEAHVPDISSGAWYGDVWKVGFELAKTPGIEFRIVKIDGGVGLFKIQQKNAELADLTDQLAHANFAYFYHNFDLLSVIDWSEAKEWIQKNLK